MTLDVAESGFLCFGDKFSVKTLVPGNKRNIHQRAVFLVDCSVKHLRAVKVVIEESGFLAVDFVDCLSPADLQKPLEDQPADVDVVAGGSVVERFAVGVGLVLQHCGCEWKCVIGDEVVADNHDGNACRAYVLLDTAPDYAVPAHVNRLAQEH